MEDSKIYVSCFEYSRLCRVDGMMDALISYINHEEHDDRNIPRYAATLDIDTVKAIIGMYDQ